MLHWGNKCVYKYGTILLQKYGIRTLDLKCLSFALKISLMTMRYQYITLTALQGGAQWYKCLTLGTSETETKVKLQH